MGSNFSSCPLLLVASQTGLVSWAICLSKKWMILSYLTYIWKTTTSCLLMPTFGVRVGFITYGIKNGSKELYKALEDKTAGAARGNISSSPHPSQSIFLQALKSEDCEKEKQTNKGKIKERFER